MNLLPDHTYQIGDHYYTIKEASKRPTGTIYNAIFHGIKRNKPYNSHTQLHSIMLSGMYIKDVTN